MTGKELKDKRYVNDQTFDMARAIGKILADELPKKQMNAIIKKVERINSIWASTFTMAFHRAVEAKK